MLSMSPEPESVDVGKERIESYQRPGDAITRDIFRPKEIAFPRAQARATCSNRSQAWRRQLDLSDNIELRESRQNPFAEHFACFPCMPSSNPEADAGVGLSASGTVPGRFAVRPIHRGGLRQHSEGNNEPVKK